MNYGVYAPNSGRVVNAQLKVLIADIALTNVGSFESIPIPAGFDHLEIVAALRSTAAVTTDLPYLYYNGDLTAANYSNQNLGGVVTTASTARGDVPRFSTSSGASSLAGDYSVTTASIPFCAATGYRRSATITNGTRLDATNQVVNIFAHNWESTEPITSITIRTDNHPTDLFATGSRVQVFGLGTFAVALAR